MRFHIGSGPYVWGAIQFLPGGEVREEVVDRRSFRMVVDTLAKLNEKQENMVQWFEVMAKRRPRFDYGGMWVERVNDDPRDSFPRDPAARYDSSWSGVCHYGANGEDIANGETIANGESRANGEGVANGLWGEDSTATRDRVTPRPATGLTSHPWSPTQGELGGREPVLLGGHPREEGLASSGGGGPSAGGGASGSPQPPNLPLHPLVEELDDWKHGHQAVEYFSNQQDVVETALQRVQEAQNLWRVRATEMFSNPDFLPEQQERIERAQREYWEEHDLFWSRFRRLFPVKNILPLGADIDQLRRYPQRQKNALAATEWVFSMYENRGTHHERTLQPVVFIPGGPGVKRSFYRTATGDIHLAKSQRDHPEVVVHELGHWLEGRIPEIGRRAREFLKYRTAGEPLTSLKASDLGGGDYEDHEMGRRDHFDRAFNNDPTDALYVGKHYDDGSTEIVAMGLQKLYQQPVTFAQRDPEYFRFLMAMLRGGLK